MSLTTRVKGKILYGVTFFAQIRTTYVLQIILHFAIIQFFIREKLEKCMRNQVCKYPELRDNACAQSS